jgi:hydrogenase maturation protein HypF
VLSQAIGWERLQREGAELFEGRDIASLASLLRQSRLAPLCTSAGRLFDAAAWIILGVTEVQFEGQAAMMLEAVADSAERLSYPITVRDEATAELDWRSLFASLWDDRLRGESPAAMASRFHRALADGVALIAARWPHVPLVCSGGVFQNRVLSEILVEEFIHALRLRLPGDIPPNDGGIAAGQLALASSLEFNL